VPLPADPVDALYASTERRRREAMLGRTTAGTPGDVDAGGVGVSEAQRDAVMERLDSALAWRDKVLAVVEGRPACQPGGSDADAGCAAIRRMADRHVHQADALARSTGALREAAEPGDWEEDEDLREAIPGLDGLLEEMDGELVARRRDRAPGAAFREFLAEGADLEDLEDDDIADIVREGLEA
jgi:hypothetical protein